MNHTERNCTRVAEDDKEQGYGWGLEMKASPRKGFYKHKEEVENLKLKKTLFVTKPNSPLIEDIETHEQPSTGKEISMAAGLELNVEKGSGGAGTSNNDVDVRNLDSTHAYGGTHFDGNTQHLLGESSNAENKGEVCVVGSDVKVDDAQGENVLGCVI
ncbi:unnamed protein product [Amaranthus hypochondriacus]